MGNKTIKAGYRASEIQVSRGGDASFNPMLIPEQKKVEGRENVVDCLSAKGMGASNIEEQIGGL
ncbi:hypothetical protein [Flavobacterium sp. JP2137]|uniref:hypothetical protein n=1 Tax=Flavobacterium sp. JP2137 TaxID=3414510 RepID=UPI003D2FAF17